MPHRLPDTHQTIKALVGVALLGIATIAGAQTPEERGLEIATEADLRDQGFGDTKVILTMTLRNKNGDERTRQMHSSSLEVSDDGDKSLIVFDDPADVKGTALLTHSHKAGPDDQWLFLPALKRTKRISSSNKSGPFVGSEFAYEDLSSQEIEKYTYKYLRDEDIDGRAHFVMERYPVDKKSGYTRQMVWIDQEHYRVVKVDFYDRKKSKLKTLVSSDFQQYLDKYWRPARMEMVNHQTGKSTVLTFTDYAFQSGLKASNFNRNSLTKAR
ncbi:MAG: outer membrane lipoprotein-sorting protein [Gammaproteobacteria bacterium]